MDVLYRSLTVHFVYLFSLDILATIHVDMDLEQEQTNAAIQTSFLLIQSLRFNGDITKQVEDNCITNFNNNLKDLDKRLQDDLRKELEVIYTDLSAKNKVTNVVHHCW